MNAVTIICLVLIAAAFTAALIHIFRRGSGCSGCPLSAVCPKERNKS